MKRRVEDPVGGIEPAEDESLEEPGGMRQMPLGRADIGHRLDRLVFGRQARREGFAVAADLLEAAAERSAVGLTSVVLGANFDHRESP